MQKTGAEIIWESLLKEGVDVVFGYPGGSILPTYDALAKYPEIHHVLVRHEQGAAHMADGYARATGRVGVAIATSGPGATNLVTGIATAKMDSSPVVFITGQVATRAIGTDAFQEVDTTGITLPIAKHSYLVQDVDELAFTLCEAFHIARSGRPGPVLVDVPKDVQIATTEFTYPEEDMRVCGYRPPKPATPAQVEQVLDMLRQGERPVVLAGQGILLAGACRELEELVTRADLPLALTLLGKGVFAEHHPLCLGMMGMHGTGQANHAIQEADLLLALGMRFDDRVTGCLASYAPQARKIHVDVDCAEIDKVVHADLGIVGDLKVILAQVLKELPLLDHGPWRERIAVWQIESKERDLLNQEMPPNMMAAEVIHAIWRLTAGEAVVVTDVGQNQMWTAQYYAHSHPRTLITSGGMGTMGFGIPAAIGAKLGRPSAEVWAVVGDGGFQMTMTELTTARQEGVAIKIALVNNGYLGMVRQWQDFFYGKRYNATPLLNPDFCKLADALGVAAIRVTEREQIDAAVEEARHISDGPVLIEFVVEQHDTVFPMVAPGAALHEMIRRPCPHRDA